MIKNLILTLIFLSACSVQVDSSEDNYFTPRQVNENPDKLDGQEILVRGYFIYGTNSRSLFQSEERYKELREGSQIDPDFDLHEFDNDCLTVLNVDLLIENHELFVEKTNTFKGVILANYLDGTVVDLQACGRPALILDEEYLESLLLSLQEGE